MLPIFSVVTLLTVVNVCHSSRLAINEEGQAFKRPGLSIENLSLDTNRGRGVRTSTSAPTTTTIRPTTSNVDVSGDVLYRLNDSDSRACALIYTDALIEIDYVTSLKESKQSSVYVPSDVRSYGKCEEDYSQFTIAWPYYKLTIYFAKNPGRDHWYVKKIDLEADLSDKHLAHVNRPPGSRLRFATPEGKSFFPTPVGNAFTCKGENPVEMTDKEISATLFLRELKMQAFLYKNDQFGPEHICTSGSTSYRDETAPIAVGSTFAIMTILTVAGYGVYRYLKVKKVQYDTME